jgi:hypothetical protein
MNDELYKMKELTKEQREWLATRKEEGRTIDPDSADVDWDYACDEDPYGIYPELPEVARQVGRHYFARSHGSDIWVEFGDLPAATFDALWRKHKASLMFPAGLPKECSQASPNDSCRRQETGGGNPKIMSTEPEPGSETAAGAKEARIAEIQNDIYGYRETINGYLDELEEATKGGELQDDVRSYLNAIADYQGDIVEAERELAKVRKLGTMRQEGFADTLAGKTRAPYAEGEWTG